MLVFARVCSCCVRASDSPRQALDIVERLDFHAVAHSTDDSIGPVMSRICEGMPAWCEFNQYQRANEAFYKGFEWLNRSYMMNSSNLEFMIEVLISQVCACVLAVLASACNCSNTASCACVLAVLASACNCSNTASCACVLAALDVPALTSIPDHVEYG